MFSAISLLMFYIQRRQLLKKISGYFYERRDGIFQKLRQQIIYFNVYRIDFPLDLEYDDLYKVTFTSS